MSAHDIWKRPELADVVLRHRRDGSQEATFRLAALGNAKQIVLLDRLIHAIPGVQRVRIDSMSLRAHVVWDGALTSLPALLAAFDRMHCPAQPLPSDADDEATSEARDLLKRLLVAGMFAMQVMTYAFVIYLGVVDFVDFTTRHLFRWLGFLSSLPVIFYSAKPFVKGAMRELRDRTLGINQLVTIAVWIVFLASALNTLRGSGEVYFDSITMFVFLLLVARYVECRAQHRNAAIGNAFADGSTLIAQRRRDDGELESTPAMGLLPGDRVHVTEGATVPADGVLESATASVDESSFSGESRPVRRYRGDQLLAGSIIVEGPAAMRVANATTHTVTARLGSPATRSRLAREAATRVDHKDLHRFVTRVLLLVLGTSAGWLVVDPGRAFEATIAVLVIACPCAFALTAPSALGRALAVLAQRGVLVTNASALKALARVDIAVFDKTGTLTLPSIDLSATHVIRADDISWTRLAGALAAQSSHPVSRAVAEVTAASPAILVNTASVIAGFGVVGEINGRSVRLGRQMDRDDNEKLWLSDDVGPIAALQIDERLRSDAAATLSDLKADGIRSMIASGDIGSRVWTAAAQLGVAESYARQTPQDKLALLKAKRNQGHVVLAVGDGNNDAPLLAAADVSAALTAGTELAQANADFLLLHGKLHGLVEARQIAIHTCKIIDDGRRWSLAYNLVAMPFAALGMVPPWLAALGMSVSSLAVVLNAMRVGRTREVAST
ncbi:cation-translocating P-type ATPase [Dyella sp. C11]|uniref:heavy metal translocating P-type ATPase n=1 Tax=Dyella sp. C11 TaxID=2126991 RepID=UPI000D65AB35|nr:cation-translocating P-type ATPase [Dyella sp. C11]